MHNQIAAVLQQYAMLSQGEHVVVGLSGGADSVCLLHLLCGLRESLSLQITAVHVNHGIRGEEAARDEQFCKAFCAQLQVPLRVFQLNVPAVAAETGEGLELCGRRLRYAAFQEVVGSSVAKIATAHTADDNAETVLLHLIRGAGLQGLCGILPVRDNIIRPLLFSTRNEVEQYCAAHQLCYQTDSTNADPAYSRNRVRREILPALTAMNPEVLAAFTRMTASLRADAAYLQASAAQAAKTAVCANGICEQALLQLPVALAKRVLQTELQTRASGQITAAHVDMVYDLLCSGKTVVLPGALRVRSRNGFLEFPTPGEKAWEIALAWPLETQQVQTPAGTILLQRMQQKDLQNLHKERLANAVDCATIEDNLVLRSRIGGDCFTDRARRVTKSLKKWFNEKKIPPEQRNQIPLLVSGEKVLWAGSFGTSAPFLPTEATRDFLVLTLQCGGNTNG